MKHCEVCLKGIPEDFGNLLCLDCYDKQIAEIEQKKQDAEGEKEKIDIAPKTPYEVSISPEGIKGQKEAENTPTGQLRGNQGVLNPSYQTNPQKEDKEQWESNIAQFDKTKKLLWHPTRNLYTHIKDYCIDKVISHPQYPKFIWKPTIVDVGCGAGIGSNVLSQEADFVWGIDKNEKSILFAQEAFTRLKNNIYYSSQVTFDRIDIMEDTREFLKFDIVVAIEIIEHIENAFGFIETIIKKFTKRGKHGTPNIEVPTEFFISTPNRNHPTIQKDKPFNVYHVREWTSEEFIKVLSYYFENVELYSPEVRPISKEEWTTTIHTPLLARTSLPKI